MFKNRISFTLMEILVVMVMVGVIVSSALATFNRSIEIAHERAGALELRMLMGAMNIYKSKNGLYPADADVDTTAEINARLKLNLTGEYFTYDCIQVNGGIDFDCKATSVKYPWKMHIHSDYNHAQNCAHCLNTYTCPTSVDNVCY